MSLHQKCSWRQAINRALMLKGCKAEIVSVTSRCAGNRSVLLIDVFINTPFRTAPCEMLCSCPVLMVKNLHNLYIQVNLFSVCLALILKESEFWKVCCLWIPAIYNFSQTGFIFSEAEDVFSAKLPCQDCDLHCRPHAFVSALLTHSLFMWPQPQNMKYLLQYSIVLKHTQKHFSRYPSTKQNTFSQWNHENGCAVIKCKGYCANWHLLLSSSCDFKFAAFMHWGEADLSQ